MDALGWKIHGRFVCSTCAERELLYMRDQNAWLKKTRPRLVDAESTCGSCGEWFGTVNSEISGNAITDRIIEAAGK